MSERVQRALKRVFDLAGSVLALVLFSPLMVSIALAIKLNTPGPIFFTQMRPGLDGRSFRIYKFRTMRDLRDTNGNPLPDAQRLTRLGRFLRRTSLDELPELWNVLRDEMSLVGPRPLLTEYLHRYTPEQARRHKVKPGVTGLAQISGRNTLSWEKRFFLDVWYVDHWSLWLDAKILLLTIGKVLCGEGISEPGHGTEEEFRGTNL